MDIYIVTLTIVGFVILLTAWLPMMMRKLPLSLPIACLAIGAFLLKSPGQDADIYVGNLVD